MGDAELQRLAQKAWPDEKCLNIDLGYDSEVTDGYGYTQARVAQHDRSSEALHAALLVLAGELDVAALVAEVGELRKSLAYAMQMHDERTQERNCCIDKLNALNRARKHSGAARAIELLREDAATFSLIEPKDVTDAYYAIAALLEEPETCSNTGRDG